VAQGLFSAAAVKLMMSMDIPATRIIIILLTTWETFLIVPNFEIDITIS